MVSGVPLFMDDSLWFIAAFTINHEPQTINYKCITSP